VYRCVHIRVHMCRSIYGSNRLSSAGFELNYCKCKMLVILREIFMLFLKVSAFFVEITETQKSAV